MAKNQDRSEQYVRQVAGEIMEQIKAGVAPWQEPWVCILCGRDGAKRIGPEMQK